MTALSNTCVNCQEPTPNPRFCSRSCSSSYNNRKNPKRKPIQKYCVCGVEVFGRKTKCSECNQNIKNWKSITIADIHADRKYQRNSRIRTLARKDYIASGRPRLCAICEYSKHFEVAHIVDISAFSPDTPVSVVNDMSNVIALCKNHHWEFDHDML